MVISSGFIMPLFLVAFVATCYQYYRVDPKRRVLNLRFALMAVTSAGAVSYPMVSYIYKATPRIPALSQAYLAVGLICLAASVLLLRRMPPAKQG